MKITFLALLRLVPLSAFAGDMQKYLSTTQDLVKRGEHQDALTRFIWFHDHSLEHDPAMYGVRLSFALAYWKQLADEYPPALEAMIGIRDRKTTLLLSGKAKTALFHDVVALNRTLEEDQKTIDLFERFDAERPQEARDLWEVAKDALFEAKRYDIIAKYIGDPRTEFIKIKAMYDMNTAMYGDDRFKDPHFKEYNENRFVEESLRLIEVASQLSNSAAAYDIQEKALAVLDDPRLRAAVSEQRGRQ